MKKLLIIALIAGYSNFSNGQKAQEITAVDTTIIDKVSEESGDNKQDEIKFLKKEVETLKKEMNRLKSSSLNSNKKIRVSRVGSKQVIAE